MLSFLIQRTEVLKRRLDIFQLKKKKKKDVRRERIIFFFRWSLGTVTKRAGCKPFSRHWGRLVLGKGQKKGLEH